MTVGSYETTGRQPPKENASPLATNLSKGRSDEELGELVGESKDQIRRYIRLTELVPEILQMVDERQIAFRPAVEVSYLTEEQQYTLLEAMEYNDALSQSITAWTATNRRITTSPHSST